MPSKPLIPDSSITEQQLAPHLRRRLAGGGSSTTTVGGGSSSTNPIRYVGGADTVTVTGDWISHQLTADTAITASGFVTGDPFTYTPDAPTFVTATANVSYNAPCCSVACVVWNLDGVTVATGLYACTWVGTVPAGSQLTPHLVVYGCNAAIESVEVVIRG